MREYYVCNECGVVHHTDEIQWDYAREEVGFFGSAPAYQHIDITRCPSCGRQDSLVPHYEIGEDKDEED